MRMFKCVKTVEDGSKNDLSVSKPQIIPSYKKHPTTLTNTTIQTHHPSTRGIKPGEGDKKGINEKCRNARKAFRQQEKW